MDWLKMRKHAMEILSEESRLSQIVKLVGPDALPDEERLILETARLLREGFLQQNAMDSVDAYSTVEKQIHMLELILHFHQRALRIVKHGAPISIIHNLPVVDVLIRMKTSVSNEELGKLDDIRASIDEQMSRLDAEYR
jgi:V/A-type H+-transporting ATPase subunit A